MRALEGRNVAILGGTGGIDQATAAPLATRGARVTIAGREQQRLAETTASLPDRAKAIQVDATDQGSLRHFYEEAGQIDDVVVTAQAALPGTAALAAVNGALEAAVPPLARELAPRRVNAVSPGVVETSWWDELPEADRKATFDQFAPQTPVGRNGNGEDVAHAIASLIENDYITGAVLPCDGGLRLT